MSLRVSLLLLFSVSSHVVFSFASALFISLSIILSVLIGQRKGEKGTRRVRNTQREMEKGREKYRKE